MGYGRAVDELRRRYREWLWDAEFRDTLGAQVTANGALAATYAVFRRSDGRRAVAFANMSDTETAACAVSLESPSRPDLHWISPELPDPQPWPGKLELSPGAVAIVIEG